MKVKFLIALFCWTVLGRAVRTIDGDTFVADFSVWHQTTARETVRVLGVDSPELRGKTREKGAEAKKFTQAWLAKGEFYINTCKRDAFGRILGTVFRGSFSFPFKDIASEILADDLIKSGHGVSR